MKRLKNICAPDATKKFHLAWDTPLQCHAKHLTYAAIGTMRAGNDAALVLLADSENVFVHF
jgi:hypothetical protein